MQLLLNNGLVGNIFRKLSGNDNLSELLNECLSDRPVPDQDTKASKELTKDQPLRIVGWHEVLNLAVPGWSDDYQYIWVCEADDSLLPLLHEMEIMGTTLF